MNSCKFTDFGLKVKMELLKIGKKQQWLQEEVTKRTGLFLDSGYIYKILTGERNAPKVVQAIREILGLDEDQETIGVNIFSPTLRDASFLARKQEYLRNVENVIGLKRGLLSEVEAAERTATEITSSAGEYNLTIIDFQRMWEETLKEAMYLCGILGQLYRVPGAHDISEDAVSVDWGNGILYDENKAWEDYKGMVAAGLLKPEIALGWRFNMPTETPEDLAAIRAKYMPEVSAEEDE